MSAENLLSHHVFLFPFKWIPTNPVEADQPLAAQTSLKLIDKFFEDSPWREEVFKINTLANYNEYNYFYDYVREVLYDTFPHKKKTSGAPAQREDFMPLHRSESGAQLMLRHYFYELGKGAASYVIETPDPENDKERKTYTLEIGSILLQLYYTGVGVLSFHLNNRDERQASPKDILWINQFGRRLYPPFFNIPKKHAGQQSIYDYDTFKGNPPWGKELAYKIQIKIAPSGEDAQPETAVSFTEEYRKHEDYANFRKDPFLLPAFIRELLPAGFTGEQGYQIIPVLDDRMFVVSWYGHDDIAARMYTAPDDKTNTPVGLNYLSDKWWYKYLFIDTKWMTCQNTVLQKELIKQATNGRWAAYDTLFGVSNYSFVLLTKSLPGLKENNASFLVAHLQTIYYKLAELVLLQRASVQRFSDEVTHISRLEKTDDQLAVRVSSLYRQYIRFVNKIYFREVTAQAQGAELYQLLQTQCRLEKQVKDLDDEINELHNYVLQTTEQERLREEKKRNQLMDKLTVLGAVFLLPSIVLGLYGSSILPSLEQPCLNHVLLLLAFLSIAVAVISWLAFTYKSKGLWITLFIIMAGALFSPKFVLQQWNCPSPRTTSDQQLPLIQKELENINGQLKKLQLPLPVVIDTTKTNIQDERQ